MLSSRGALDSAQYGRDLAGDQVQVIHRGDRLAPRPAKPPRAVLVRSALDLLVQVAVGVGHLEAGGAADVQQPGTEPVPGQLGGESLQVRPADGRGRRPGRRGGWSAGLRAGRGWRRAGRTAGGRRTGAGRRPDRSPPPAARRRWRRCGSGGPGSAGRSRPATRTAGTGPPGRPAVPGSGHATCVKSAAARRSSPHPPGGHLRRPPSSRLEYGTAAVTPGGSYRTLMDVLRAVRRRSGNDPGSAGLTRGRPSLDSEGCL
jgi:hypothetical protein